MFYENRWHGGRAFKVSLPYILIVSLIAVSRFYMISEFGLYEDDWAFSGNAITNDLDQNLGRMTSAFTTFWQGRPLHMLFLTLIPALAGKLGSLKALYVIGFIILCANACLLYSLLGKITTQPLIPSVTAAFFGVYSADTTFNYLQHLLGLQTSLLFVLLAFHFYLSSPKNLSYIFATLSLLTYESIFFLFFIAPFLGQNNNKINTISHSLKTSFTLAAYIVVRRSFGEERVTDLDIISTLSKVGLQVLVGSLVSLSTFGLRPLQVFAHLRFINLIVLLIFSITLFFVFLFLAQVATPQIAWENQKKREETFKELKRLFLIGVGMIFLSYPTAIILSVRDISGRASRVHFAAAMGASLIIGCLWTLISQIGSNKNIWKNTTIFLLSLHLSFLALFCIQVQSFYKLSWDYQKAFWSDILRLAPDLENNTVILVDAPSLQRYGKQINPFDWSMPSVLNSLYKFPRDWENYPRLYLLNSFEKDFDFWSEMIDESYSFLLSGKGNSLVYYYTWEPDRIVESYNVILITEENNRLTRHEVLDLGNISISLKIRAKSDNVLSKLPQSILFKELISYPSYSSEKDAIPIYFKPQA